jgi:hypothetical protein
MLPALASHWLEEFANSSAEYFIIDQSFAACCNPFILKINEASETFKTCGVSYYGPEIFVRELFKSRDPVPLTEHPCRTITDSSIKNSL